MADVVKGFNYSKGSGRGRGILGLTNFEPCRRPGERSERTVELSIRNKSEEKSGKDNSQADPSNNGEKEPERCLLLASHQYKANPNMPLGFPELSLEKGELVEFIREHPDERYEEWWEAKNEDGEVGFVPSTYVIVKRDISLPWLQLSALQSEEEERKRRVQRVAMKKAAAEGKGFGPPPKPGSSSYTPKPYVSAYARDQPSSNQSQSYYCDVCEKKFNGPKPFQAHMSSKAHKEELALRES